ncbi:hypothetical protein HT031_006074 [Scenedesmus sp. PABB004]|nr:hypothetical protein HT031_006074 [Scenedesmus sp. PABB004]
MARRWLAAAQVLLLVLAASARSHSGRRTLLQQRSCPEGCATTPGACVPDSSAGGFRCLQCVDSRVPAADGSCGCSPGRFLNASTRRCDLCATGSWCPGGGEVQAASSTACASGLTTRAPGAASRADCVNAPGYSFGLDGSGAPSATPCPAHSYSIGYLRQPRCTPCARGLRTNNTGADATRTSAAVCLVPPGWRWGAGAAARCARGTFRAGWALPGVDAATCAACPNGTTTTGTASTSCSAVAAGFYWQDAATVAPCPLDSFCPGSTLPPASGVGSTLCSSIRGGLRTQATATSTSDGCLIPPGYYGVAGGNVSKCSNNAGGQGFYQPSWLPGNSSDACQACGAGILSEDRELSGVPGDATPVPRTSASCYITGGQSVVLSSVLEAAMLINPTPPVRAAPCSGSTQYSTVGSNTKQYGLNLTRCGECTRGTIVPVPLATGNIGLASCSSVTAGFGYDPAASSLVTAVASTKPCPANSNNPNATLPITVGGTSCTCVAGTGSYSFAAGCSACGDGTFSTGGSTAACTSCGSNAGSSSLPRTSSANCICNAGYANYVAGSGCTQCAAGFVQLSTSPLVCGGCSGSRTTPAGNATSCWCPAGTGALSASDTCTDCGFGTWGAFDATDPCQQCVVPLVPSVSFGSVGSVALVTTAATRSTASTDCVRGVLSSPTGMTVTTSSATTVQACATACAGNATCAYITYTLAVGAPSPEQSASAVTSCRLHNVDPGLTYDTFRVAYKLSSSTTYSWWRHVASLDAASIGGVALATSSASNVAQCLSDCSAQAACAAVLFNSPSASWTATTAVTCTLVMGQAANATLPADRTLLANVGASASNATTPLPQIVPNCPVGTYLTGFTCTACPSGKTTVDANATSVISCVCATGSWGTSGSTGTCTQCAVPAVVTTGSANSAIALVVTLAPPNNGAATACGRGAWVAPSGGVYVGTSAVLGNGQDKVQDCINACARASSCQYITFTLQQGSKFNDPEGAVLNIRTCNLYGLAGNATTSSGYRVAYRRTPAAGGDYSWWRHIASVSAGSIGGFQLPLPPALASAPTRSVQQCLDACDAYVSCSAVLFNLDAFGAANPALTSTVTACTLVSGQVASDVSAGGFRCLQCVDSRVPAADGSCGCSPGRVLNTSTRRCDLCATGSWCPGGGEVQAASSTACAAGLTTRAPGASSRADCVNAPGYSFGLDASGAPSATPCPAHSYSVGYLRQPRCTPCARGLRTNNTGADTTRTSAAVCLVPPGRRWGAGAAVRCARGTFRAGWAVPGVDAATCAACPTGATTNGTGSTNCTAVAAGFYWQDGTTVAPCPLDSYCPGSTLDPAAGVGSIACSSIRAGLRTQRTGTSTPDGCLIPPGYYGVAGGVVSKCSNNVGGQGFYQPSWLPGNSSDACQACGAGILSEDRESSAVPGDATLVPRTSASCYITGGQSVVLSSVLEAAMLINPTPPVRAATCNGSTQYSTVSSSTRQYGLNLTRCGECTRGTIVPVPLASGNIGLASCSSVTAGFGYDPAASSLVTAVASTKPCPANSNNLVAAQSITVGGTSCTCVAGTGSYSFTAGCSACGDGTFSTGGSTAACTSCGPNAGGSTLPRTSSANCTCNAGYATYASPSSGCTQCTTGFFRTSPVGAIPVACTACNGTRTTAGPGTGNFTSCWCPAGTGALLTGGTCADCAIGSWGAFDASDPCQQCVVPTVPSVSFGSVGAVALVTTAATRSTASTDCVRGVLSSPTGMTVTTSSAATVQACADACAGSAACAYITYTLAVGAPSPEQSTSLLTTSSCRLHSVNTATVDDTFRLAYKLASSTTYSWWRHIASLSAASIGGLALATSSASNVAQCLSDCSAQAACAAVLLNSPSASWSAITAVSCTLVRGQAANATLPADRTLLANLASLASSATSPLPSIVPNCPVGTYLTGFTCTACPSGKTTVDASANSVNSCVCPTGWWGLSGSSGACTQCAPPTQVPKSGNKEKTAVTLVVVAAPPDNLDAAACGRGVFGTPSSDAYVATSKAFKKTEKVKECIEACAEITSGKSGSTDVSGCHYVTYTLADDQKGADKEEEQLIVPDSCTVVGLASPDRAAPGYRVAYKRAARGDYSWWVHVDSVDAASVGGSPLRAAASPRTVQECLEVCSADVSCGAVLFDLGGEEKLSLTSDVKSCKLVAGQAAKDPASRTLVLQLTSSAIDAPAGRKLLLLVLAASARSHSGAAAGRRTLLQQRSCPEGCATTPGACVPDGSSGSFVCLQCVDNRVPAADGSCGCSPGRVLNASTRRCDLCATGSWCPGGGEVQAASSTACAAGLTTRAPGASSRADCVNAPGYSFGLDASGAPSATPCPAHSYSVGYLRQPRCTPCARGLRTNNTGADATRTSVAVCLVPPGWRWGAGAAARCARGTFRSGWAVPSLDAATCASCPTGTTTNGTASTNCTAVAAGFYWQDAATVAPCPPDSFCPGSTLDPAAGVGSIACSSIRAGLRTQATGTSTSDGCLIPPGYYGVAGGGVSKCSNNVGGQGFYQPSWLPGNSSDACQACGAGILSADRESSAVPGDTTPVPRTSASCYITGGQSVVLSSVLEAAMLINPTPPVRAATCNGSTQYSTVGSNTRQYGLNLTRCGECTRGTLVPAPNATGNIGLASCSSVTAGFGYDPAASSLITAVASTKPCPANSNNPNATLPITVGGTSCTCVAGTGNYSFAAGCSACTDGTFSTGGSTAACTSCGSNAGSSSLPRTSSANCTCNAGYATYASPSSGCTQCTTGFGRISAVGASPINCTACTGSRTTAGPGTNDTSFCWCPAGTGALSASDTCTDCAIGSWGAFDATDPCQQCVVPLVPSVSFGSVGSVALVTTAATRSTASSDCVRGVLSSPTGMTVTTSSAATVQACADACAGSAACAYITYTLAAGASSPEQSASAVTSCRLHSVNTIVDDTFRVAYKLASSTTYSWWRHVASLDAASIGGVALATSSASTVAQCLSDCSAQSACAAVLLNSAIWTTPTAVTCTLVRGQAANATLPADRTLLANLGASASNVTTPLPPLVPSCALGSYLNGTACSTCPSGKTTLTTNATSVTSCVCPTGSFGTAGATGTCTQCPLTVVSTQAGNSAVAVVIPAAAGSNTLASACRGRWVTPVTPAGAFTVTTVNTTVVSNWPNNPKLDDCINACANTASCQYFTFTIEKLVDYDALEAANTQILPTSCNLISRAAPNVTGFRIAYKRSSTAGDYSWWRHVAVISAASIGGSLLTATLPPSPTVQQCMNACDGLMSCGAVLISAGTETSLTSSTVVACSLVSGQALAAPQFRTMVLQRTSNISSPSG